MNTPITIERIRAIARGVKHTADHEFHVLNIPVAIKAMYSIEGSSPPISEGTIIRVYAFKDSGEVRRKPSEPWIPISMFEEV